MIFHEVLAVFNFLTRAQLIFLKQMIYFHIYTTNEVGHQGSLLSRPGFYEVSTARNILKCQKKSGDLVISLSILVLWQNSLQKWFKGKKEADSYKKNGEFLLIFCLNWQKTNIGDPYYSNKNYNLQAGPFFVPADQFVIVLC